MHGPSYTDVNAVLPAKTILAIIALLCAALFFAGVVRPGGMLPGVAFGLLVLSAVLIGGVYPALVEQFQVKPNQQAKEAPYIERNIEATRKAYGVEDTQVEEYGASTNADAGPGAGGHRHRPRRAPARPDADLRHLPAAGSGSAATTSSRTKLDIDRYTIDGVETDTVVAVREVEPRPRRPTTGSTAPRLHPRLRHGRRPRQQGRPQDGRRTSSRRTSRRPGTLGQLRAAHLLRRELARVLDRRRRRKHRARLPVDDNRPAGQHARTPARAACRSARSSTGCCTR